MKPPGAMPKRPRVSNAAGGVRSPAGAHNSKGKQKSAEQPPSSYSGSVASNIQSNPNGQGVGVDPDDHVLFSPDEMDHDAEANDVVDMDFDGTENLGLVSDQVDF